MLVLFSRIHFINLFNPSKILIFGDQLYSLFILEIYKMLFKLCRKFFLNSHDQIVQRCTAVDGFLLDLAKTFKSYQKHSCGFYRWAQDSIQLAV